ncbi:cation diffusion facilitator family transporter [Cerasicoccus fimbriatus]|uniref:cation diffusion facilitator family transporter n=1 Tax=Cerasicoccus fimbriatus TaxID=3014554 RepID=UPI0022B4EA36|nr:cation diffusion facilitator family transporter [Cerasicoccus sp. TK19100]
MPSEAIAAEHRALRFSIWGNLVLGFLGIIFAVFSRSDAVLLDGVFSLINFVVALLSLKVAKMILRPTDDRYPFGYVYYEPMLNLGKGLLIALVCLLAFVSSVEALIHGGREIEAGVAFFYAIAATVIAGFLALNLRKMARQCSSPIVDVDAKNWLLDTILSAVIAVALLVVYLLENSRFSAWTPYADPFAVMVLTLVFFPIPVQIIRHNWAQILGRNVDAQLLVDARQTLAEFLQDKAHLSSEVRAVRAGRFVYLHLFIVIAKDAPWPQNVAEQDACRRAILNKLKPAYPYLVVDVIVTHDPDWAEIEM